MSNLDNTAPPQHPAINAGTTNTNAVGGTAPNSEGQSEPVPPIHSSAETILLIICACLGLGEKVKGGFQAIHGLGEGIRGNINSFVDGAGEQIAGRGDSAAHPTTRTENGQTPNQVAANGADEFKQGLNAMKK